MSGVNRANKKHERDICFTVPGVTRETLGQWCECIAKEGIIGLTAKAGRGREAGLTKQIEEDLKVQLWKPPSELGYTQVIWDGKLVCKYIKEQYSLTIAVRTSQHWLEKKMGLPG